MHFVWVCSKEADGNCEIIQYFKTRVKQKICHQRLYKNPILKSHMLS